MNDETHDDSSYVLDRATTFYRGWRIERETDRMYVWYHPDDEEVVHLDGSLAAAREAIDAVIAEEEDAVCEHARALPEEYDEHGRTPIYPCTVRCPDCGELIHVGRRS